MRTRTWRRRGAAAVSLATAAVVSVPAAASGSRAASAPESPVPPGCSVQGAIADRWYRLDGAIGVLGRPVTCELATPSRHGRFTHFERGSIYWSPGTGAWEVRGLIRERWAGMGWETSWLGFPVTGEQPTRTRPGAFQAFEGGSVFWCPGVGAHAVRGAIRDAWASAGGETGLLGCPTTSETALPRGAFTHFEGGSVYWSPATGAHLVRGAIRDAWARHGWEAGVLGYPVSDEYDLPSGRRSDFEGGYVTWSPGGGAIVVPRRAGLGF
ncbi:LGFP repeat-containing protein [Kineococcus xinjiangensis]|uniref:LGFP repeat-containing protein n=1 Tax=Kineococcus xinjiangensis TaxID=512762 RepID=A0A2S6IKI0_9ACTN|nr:hypothetical protein [Kineococcus xinjiangensis]PPK94737.1 LGFP repeat-containing protein [Kineococcus xinjiangensis]